MNRLNKTASAFFVSLMFSLLPEDLYSELISCAAPEYLISDNGNSICILGIKGNTLSQNF